MKLTKTEAEKYFRLPAIYTADLQTEEFRALSFFDSQPEGYIFSELQKKFKIDSDLLVLRVKSALSKYERDNKGKASKTYLD